MPKHTSVPPVLRVGFRPFFFGAAAFAAFAIASWVMAHAGHEIVAPAFAPQRWHAHEMVFGYAAGVITGFLLTAIPNWTGRLPVAGWRLGMLFALWLAARVAMASSAHTGALLAAILDVGYLASLSGVILREIASGKNWRNLPVCIVTGLLALASALSHLGQAEIVAEGLGIRLGIATVCGLIVLIGGRIIPSFTRNWMAKKNLAPLPAAISRYDQFAILVAIIALASWAIWPDLAVSGGLLLLATVIHLVRLWRWRGIATGSDALVLILHIGYLWLPVGFAILGTSILFPGLVPGSVALHGLTAGAIAVMTIAVMTRATLGHSGRALHAGGATITIYCLINAGVLLRLFSPWLPVDYGIATLCAGLIWGAGYLLFAVAYAPLLLGLPKAKTRAQ